jgi:hypothetical protein
MQVLASFDEGYRKVSAIVTLLSLRNLPLERSEKMSVVFTEVRLNF